MNRKGFTLIELMIAVVIIVLLAAISVPKFISMQQRVNEAKTKGRAHTVQFSAEDYAIVHKGVYPAKVKDFYDFLILENAFAKDIAEPHDTNFNPPMDPQVGAIYYYRDHGDAYVILAYGKYPENGPILTLVP